MDKLIKSRNSRGKRLGTNKWPAKNTRPDIVEAHGLEIEELLLSFEILFFLCIRKRGTQMNTLPGFSFSPQTTSDYPFPTATPGLGLSSSAPPQLSVPYSQDSYSLASYNSANIIKASKLISPVKPNLPSYLADTSFAELYHSVNLEPFSLNGLYEEIDSQQPLALPTEWNIEDKCPNLELSADRLMVNYTVGAGKHETDAAAIRANYPMPPQCGLFYFEVYITSKGKDGYIGIGFCTKSVNLARLPGWEDQSWGYHGDDGNSFCCSGTGKNYGPKFTTGDTIGCCLNFRDGTAFYTKNGVHLGIAFRDLKGVLYPSIGLRTPGEKILVNFGQREFKFAIEHYMKEEKARLWNTINATPMPTIPTPKTSPSVSIATSEANLTARVHQLIISYLVHHGFSETAKVFSNNAVQLPTNGTKFMTDVENDNLSIDLDVDILNRQRIRNAIIKGDIDLAIKLTNTLYPMVLPSNHDILFKLRCRKFIEMIQNCGIRSSEEGAHGVVRIFRDDTIETMVDDEDPKEAEAELEEEIGVEEGLQLEREINELEVDEEEEEEYEDAMDVDGFEDSENEDDHRSYLDDNHLHYPASKKKKFTKWSKPFSNQLDVLSAKFEDAMRFGQQLQEDYQNDPREEIKKTLEETFSLLAYSDPTNSVMAYLLEPSEREPVANSLNSAILVSQGKPPIPPLETVYRHASVLIKECLKNGIGAASFGCILLGERRFYPLKPSFMSRKRLRTDNSPDLTAESNKPLKAKNPDLALDFPTRFEPSIFNVQPTNDFIRVVSDFLYEHVDKEDVEIEAKLGILVQKNTKQRIQLPISCETIIDPKDDRWLKFESNMSSEEHCNFNKILNARVEATKIPHYVGAPVNYKHTLETDRFYPGPDGSSRIRVTTLQKTGEVLEGGIMEKIRIADLNIYSPNTRFDFRISVNMERPKEKPQTQPIFERNKDRISYSHQIFKFDLTQVKIPEKPSMNGFRNPSQEVTHELEVEFVNPKILLQERRKIEKGESNRFIEVVELFVDNIRMLAKQIPK
ncbi:hypothetical protein G9A89_023731 [Geosiphon pyriformis]|nr:hypothetical protein G9A89_023731 [Geosiphon pyriformis]